MAPGTPLPPVWALAAGAATPMAATHASPTTARIVRLLVNLPLSLLTGLADGLALKVRATRRSGRDSPQLLGPPISVYVSDEDSAEVRAAR